MKKDLAIIFGLFLVIALLVVFGQGFSTIGFLTATNQTQVKKDFVDVRINSFSVKAKVADLPDERKKGLSKLDSLPMGEGLFFVFDNPGSYGIWMKDMKFAIDILWIGEDRKVMAIAINVPPEPGKKDPELAVYKPDGNAKYVLEVNAGLVNLNGIKAGDQVNFEL